MEDELEAAVLDARLTRSLRYVLEWSRATFPDRQALAAARHLEKEAHEVQQAVVRRESMRVADPDGDAARGEAEAEELADVLMLTAALADLRGIDLASAVDWKLAVLKTRRWGDPDAGGVREHIRDEEQGHG